jgi:hypothetical protein
MSTDPGTDPGHDLAEFPQDDDLRPPRIALGTVTALLRVAAGRRGHAAVVWHRGGFTHHLVVAREPGAPGVAVDADPDAIGGGTVIDRLVDALDGRRHQPYVKKSAS